MPRYQTVSRDAAIAHYNAREASPSAITPLPVPDMKGTGSAVTDTEIALVKSLETKALEGLGGNALEVAAAPYVYEGLCELPMEVLDDPDYWRYLSFHRLRDIVLRVDGEKGTGLPLRSTRETHAPTGLSNTAVMRMYLRGHLIHRTSKSGERDYSPGSIYFNAVADDGSKQAGDRDVIKSHILKVVFGETPTIACAFLEVGAKDIPLRANAGKSKPLVPDMRKLAKFFTRARNSMGWEVLTDSEAQALAEDFRQELEQMLSARASAQS
jgi:hypothetical protein